MPFTTPFHEAKAGRAGLVPGVVALVTVGTTVDNVLFCLMLNQTLLCFVGSAANLPFDDVCTGDLMVTKAIAGVTPHWFGHLRAEVESPQLLKDNWDRRGPRSVTVTLRVAYLVHSAWQRVASSTWGWRSSNSVGNRWGWPMTTPRVVLIWWSS